MSAGGPSARARSIHASTPTTRWWQPGTDPTIVKTGGCYRTDPLFPGRRNIKRRTGNYKVPTLTFDDGTIVDGSENIAAWATGNRAT